MDAEAASHKGVERPSLFESTHSMLALEGLRIVETGDHKTMHGAGQVLELLERAQMDLVVVQDVVVVMGVDQE